MIFLNKSYYKRGQNCITGRESFVEVKIGTKKPLSCTTPEDKCVVYCSRVCNFPSKISLSILFDDSDLYYMINNLGKKTEPTVNES